MVEVIARKRPGPGRPSKDSPSLKDGILAVNIVLNKYEGKIEIDFDGNWTGREVNRLMVLLPQYYRKYQRARANAGETTTGG